MAKENYKIPYTIDNIRFRALVSLKVGNMGLKRQIYIYQIVGWIFIVFATASIIYMSPMKYALGWAVPFFCAMFGLGWIGLQTQRNGLPGYRWIKPTFSYLVSKGDRIFTHVDQKNGGVQRVIKKGKKKNKVSVNFTPELQKMRGITDLDAISGEGMLSFQNGDFGVMFRVSGFTSLVILDEELSQIIDMLAKWNASLDPTTSWTLVTDRSNQRVVHQQQALKDTLDQWKSVGAIPKPVKQLLKARMDDLKAVRTRYKSSQQYLVLRSGSQEILDKEIQQLVNSTRQGMLKTLEMLEFDDLIEALDSVMKGD